MACVLGQRQVLSFPPARKLALFTGHDLSWMYNIEQDQSYEHRQRVQTVLVCLMVGNGACKTIGVLSNTEQDAELSVLLARFHSPREHPAGDS